MRIILAIMLSTSVAQAKPTSTPLGKTLLDAVPLNSAASALTFYIGPNINCGRNNSCDPTDPADEGEGVDVRSYSAVHLELAFDYDAQAGAITLTCTQGQTRATATGKFVTADLAAGVFTLVWSGVVVTPSMSADTKWPVDLNINSAPVIKCVASHGGTPGVADTITVNGWLIED